MSFAIISLDIALVLHVPVPVLARVPVHLCQRAHKAAGCWCFCFCCCCCCCS